MPKRHCARATTAEQLRCIGLLYLCPIVETTVEMNVCDLNITLLTIRYYRFAGAGHKPLTQTIKEKIPGTKGGCHMGQLACTVQWRIWTNSACLGCAQPD